MENLTNTAVHLLEDSQGADLTRREKRKLSVEITTAMIALVCLVTGLLYKGIFPEQTAVAGLIYSVGVLVEGLPLLATAIRGFLQRDVTNAMEILVSIAVLACYITGQHELAILIPVVLSVVHFLEERSIMGGRDAIEGLKQMQATDAVLETEDGEVTVEVQALKRGDIIIVRPGMGLPIDGTVIWGNSNIDQKSLTGEPLPAAVTVGDTVYAGTTNLDGMIKVRVEKEYQDTSFTKIVSLLEEAQSITVPEIRIVDRFMHYYIPLALIVAALTALLSRNISNAIAVLVVSCPCGHMLVSSAPMIAALAVSTKRGILIKNAKFVEQLTNITTVIFDKTGTITRGELSISGFYLQEAQSREELFARGGCVACSSMHPISRSLMKTLEGEGIPYEEGFQVRETAGKGLTGTRGGEEILFGSRHWIESLGYQPEDPHMDTGGGPANWVVYNGRVLGCLMFDDSVRPEAEEVVSRLHEDGMEQTVLLTGDREFAARKVHHTVRTRTQFFTRKGLGTFFVYRRFCDESTQSGKRARAGYHCDGGILPFVLRDQVRLVRTWSPPYMAHWGQSLHTCVPGRACTPLARCNTLDFVPKSVC